LVFFSAAILRELNDKENCCGHQKEMPHAALVEQNFSDDPANEQRAASKPKHNL
jgi:hypothetical protein